MGTTEEAGLPNQDPVWEQIYSEGRQLNRYPYDGVVSFVFHRAPRHVPRPQVRILEVGFGAGNNLWFCANEGFDVCGVDGSPSGVKAAQRRFEEEGLRGDLRIGDFSALPFPDGHCDLAINRAALTQTGMSVARRAVDEVRRVLKPGGYFWNDIFSDRSTSRGRPGPDGTLLDIAGPIAGHGQTCFYTRKEIIALFAEGWAIESLTHVESMDTLQKPYEVLAQWIVVARKL
ncbi:MAG TPA: class I SAM-dependent methyltransferase [Alphaproteobacteria bacterium]|nr:class I SAM-dependent methyltransferase [Alphaproteobacteria bacterium]